MSAMETFRAHMDAHMGVLGGEADPMLVEAAFLGGASAMMAALVSPAPADAHAFLARFSDVRSGLEELIVAAKLRAEAQL